jgi:hypothetical protein
MTLFGWGNALFGVYCIVNLVLVVALVEYYSLPGAQRWDVVGLVLFAFCALYSAIVATIIGFVPDRVIFANAQLLEDLSR